MNTKNLVVTFCTFALALFLVASVSAADLTTNYQVDVDGIQVATNAGLTANTASVVAGQEFTLKVYFTSDVNDTDVTLEATVEGEKIEFRAITPIFDVESNHQYRKVLILKVPYELKDQLSDDLTLSIEVDGKDYKTTFDDITLRVQRPSYNAVVMSATTPSTISAGQNFPVEIVLKNLGYNNLDDVYASVSIPELGVSQGPKWFGDLVSLENCTEDCNKQDTVVGQLYLKTPYTTKPGVYDLQVVVQNGDTKTVEHKQITISNEFVENILVVSSKKTVAVGEEAVFDLLIVNPTDNVKVYRIVTDGDVLTASQSVVAVPAGSSTTVKVAGSADKEGSYTFNVNVFEGNNLAKTVPLELNVEGSSSTNTVVVLTIVLAIIFLVLLVVLIVLLSKKPEKTEDFGESYY
ncbi:hypothetical protein COU53_01550 [Candidatus Pacearchaeota archaeon CG10_big_fil_rev_8_21_14_0_10_30_48]|nr:MAG: hypothetical protein COU53_01550 [Candidatus Pacearchaeota archaeon CG10_big_fil_rev_8_21_14_0_10_30_48]